MNNTYWHLKAALRSVLQRKGYHFVKSQWVKQCDEVTQVVCLDKSPDGDEYYLEVGVFIHLLGSPPSMLMRYAPYRARLCGRLNNEYDELLFVYLNRDVITDAERERRFRDLLESDTAFASLQMQVPKVETDKPKTTPYLEFVLQSIVASNPENSGAAK